jgi:hypothetical protein
MALATTGKAKSKATVDISGLADYSTPGLAASRDQGEEGKFILDGRAEA